MKRAGVYIEQGRYDSLRNGEAHRTLKYQIEYFVDEWDGFERVLYIVLLLLNVIRRASHSHSHSVLCILPTLLATIYPNDPKISHSPSSPLGPNTILLANPQLPNPAFFAR